MVKETNTIEGTLKFITGKATDKKGRMTTYFSVYLKTEENSTASTMCTFHGEVPIGYVGKKVKFEVSEERKYLGLVKKVHETLSLQEHEEKHETLPSIVCARY